jgi:branched-chain amino acid transport system substrate-binding protein
VLTAVDTKNPTDESPGRLWRTAPPDTIQGDAIAIYLQQQKAGNVQVIFETGAYGEGLAQVFAGGFSALGGGVGLSEFSSSTQRDAAIVAAGKGPATWVLFVSSQTADAAALLNAATTLSGYATKQLFLTDSAANQDLLNTAAGASALFPRVRGSRFAVPSGPVYEQFRASFTAAFQSDPSSYSYVAHAYDAAWLTLYGAARSQGREGLVHGLGIARGLRRLSRGVPASVDPASWGYIAKDLSLGGEVDLIGASGALDYDPLTEETKAPVDIWKIAAGGASFEVEQTLAP